MSAEIKYAWLKCKVLKEKIGRMDVEVLLQDNTPATINVHPTLVGVDDRDQSFLKVEEIGRKDDLVYIKLPRPTIEFGHNMTVKAKDITAEL